MKDFGMYGFYQSAYRPVKLERFLAENTIRFGEWYGLPLKDISVVNIEDMAGQSIAVGTREEPLSNTEGKKLCPECDMVVVYDCKSLNGLVVTEEDDWRSMWMILVQALRAWVVIHEKIGVAELLPCCLLGDFGHAKWANDLCDLYVARDLGPERIKRSFDMIFVAAYTADLISMRAQENALDPQEVGNLIFNLRRSNWRQFLPPMISLPDP